MAFFKLNKKYLPTFIYLIDLIEKMYIEVDYKEIADFETTALDQVHMISISRAFKLRKALLEGWSKKPGLPLKPTLNVLAAYCEGNETFSFLKFHMKNENAINVYFLENPPDNGFVNKLFPKRAEKINHLEVQLETVESYSNEVDANGIMEFAKGLELQFNNFQKKMENELKLKSQFIILLNDRVKELEATLAKAEFMNNKFGAIGLFFVTINYGLISKESILTDFTDDFEGFDDDVLDDLL